MALIILAAIYILFPSSTTFVILGIDTRDPEGYLGRSDTIVLIAARPVYQESTLLSIPRDLWVNIPGVGENRINTAHFYAEAGQPGSGPAAAIQAIETNFGVRLDHFIRMRFDSIVKAVDALGGVPIELPRKMAGYKRGVYTLDGVQALAFVRDRSGTGDFGRMERGQLFFSAFLKHLSNPLTWPRLLVAWDEIQAGLETNLPGWEIPRVGLSLLAAIYSKEGLNAQTITPEMVTPTVNNSGADILLPNWEAILPVVDDLFP